MPAGRYNIEIEQGADFVRTLTWTDDGAAVNLTGGDARVQVRAARGATSPLLLDMSVANGKIVLGGTAGTITLKLSAADTLALTFTTALYDLLVKLADGSEHRLLTGQVEVTPAVTYA